ncbi:unnamed protein product [Schistocephalus solidus]|uniref:Kunitz/Bovine pancreatic trypsin inhibitor domain protein n=1 Tax=Schistocephalus solidus TaxID=70667 RepID=A0A183TRJ2_SCHSO|nr:unnamed protein product [Schistocephalus solidus]
MWFHNATGCHQFIFSGCGGNENRFSSKMDCLRTCRRGDLVEGELPDPWVDMDNSTWPAAHSLTTENPSATSETTTETMKKPVPPSTTSTPTLETFTTHPPMVYNLTGFTPKSVDIEPCRMEPLAGSCLPIECQNATGCTPKRLARWYFNQHTSDCESFVYAGCGGSVNTYDSAQLCIESCKRRIMKPESKLSAPRQLMQTSPGGDKCCAVKRQIGCPTNSKIRYPSVHWLPTLFLSDRTNGGGRDTHEVLFLCSRSVLISKHHPWTKVQENTLRRTSFPFAFDPSLEMAHK